MHKGTMRRVKLALLGLAGATMFGGAAMAADHQPAGLQGSARGRAAGRV